MKTQRRHELQQNELADRLSKWLEQVQPYSKLIVGVAVVIAAVLFAIMFISNSNRRTNEASWTGYYAAASSRDPEELHKVAERYAGTKAAIWALHAAAQANLMQGSQSLYLDRGASREQLREAAEDYVSVLEKLGPSDEPLLRQRALYGLAQAYEAQNELGKAGERYEEIAKAWPESAIGKQAGQRAAALKRTDTQDFYKWFFAQKPPAPTPPRGGTSIPFGDVPQEPNISMPAPFSGVGGGLGGEFPVFDGDSPATTVGSPPAGPPEPPAGETPPLSSTEPDEDDATPPIEVRTEPASPSSSED